MSAEIHLVIKSQQGSDPIAYQCSACGKRFILPDDGSPKEAAIELWTAFKEHVQEDHT
jgi:hypothetical protein